MDSVDCEDDEGATPLMLATLGDRLDTVRALLASGANPRHASRKGDTPLHVAAQQDLADVASALVEAGADVNASSSVSSRLALGSEFHRDFCHDAMVVASRAERR